MSFLSAKLRPPPAYSHPNPQESTGAQPARAQTAMPEPEEGLSHGGVTFTRDPPSPTTGTTKGRGRSAHCFVKRDAEAMVPGRRPQRLDEVEGAGETSGNKQKNRDSPVREIQNVAKWRALERREKEMWGGPTPPQFMHEEDHMAFEGALMADEAGTSRGGREGAGLPGGHGQVGPPAMRAAHPEEAGGCRSTRWPQSFRAYQ